MKYLLAMNPKAGKGSLEQKVEKAKSVARVLGDVRLIGYDTSSSRDFSNEVKRYSGDAEIIIPYGGDGTVYDVINSIDSDSVIAPIMCGSGDALRYHFGLPKDVFEQAKKIKNSEGERFVDLIGFEDKKAFFVSVGLDGEVLKLRDEYVSNGRNGFVAYGLSTLRGLKEFEPFDAAIGEDGLLFGPFRDVKDVIITKTPFYGYGMNVVPRARDNDGVLHSLIVNQGLLDISKGIVGAFTSGNLVGDYFTSKNVEIISNRPLLVQLNGNVQEESRDSYSFRVLPNALKVRC